MVYQLFAIRGLLFNQHFKHAAPIAEPLFKELSILAFQFSTVAQLVHCHIAHIAVEDLVVVFAGISQADIALRKLRVLVLEEDRGKGEEHLAVVENLTELLPAAMPLEPVLVFNVSHVLEKRFEVVVDFPVAYPGAILLKQ